MSFTKKTCPIIGSECTSEACLAYHRKLGFDDNNYLLEFLYTETRETKKPESTGFWPFKADRLVTIDHTVLVVAERRVTRCVCLALSNLRLKAEAVTVLIKPHWVDWGSGGYGLQKVSEEAFSNLVKNAKPLPEVPRKWFDVPTDDPPLAVVQEIRCFKDAIFR